MLNGCNAIFQGETCDEGALRALDRKRTQESIRIIGGAVAARLRDQVKDTAEFGAWPLVDECLEFRCGQAVAQIGRHVEMLPPAVHHFVTGVTIAAGFLTVGEGNRATQPGAANFQFVFFHDRHDTFRPWCALGWRPPSGR